MDNKNNLVDIKVTIADNGVQIYVEELQPPVEGIRYWKIAKVFYSIDKATKYARTARRLRCF